jgi:hypothetical protein
MSALASIVDVARYPLSDAAFQAACRETLAETGALVMPGFLLLDPWQLTHPGRCRQDRV